VYFSIDYFSHLYGNDHVKRYLSSMVDRKSIANSILFAGPEGIGKSQFALAFASIILSGEDPNGNHKHKIETGRHPDVHIYRPEGKVGLHSINAMRQFIEEVDIAPYEAKRKIFIIHDADRMLPYSANALLKTFEEPAADSIIMLLSSTPQALLSTVMSRCYKIYFHALPESCIADFIQRRCNKTEQESLAIAAKAHGSIGRAMRLIEEGDCPLRQQTLSLLAAGKVASHKELSDIANQLADAIDGTKSHFEEAARESLLKGLSDNLTAVQKQSLEKEIEGIGATQAFREAHAIFDVILGWHRDLQLLQVGGDPKYLIHKDILDAEEQALQRGEGLPLETVQKAISEARISLDRSTSLNICLETLFLKLNFL
jgi:DNA polymerase III subunit delta'